MNTLLLVFQILAYLMLLVTGSMVTAQFLSRRRYLEASTSFLFTTTFATLILLF